MEKTEMCCYAKAIRTDIPNVWLPNYCLQALLYGLFPAWHPAAVLNDGRQAFVLLCIIARYSESIVTCVGQEPSSTVDFLLLTTYILHTTYYMAMLYVEKQTFV